MDTARQEIPWMDDPEWSDGTSPAPDLGNSHNPTDSPIVLAAIVIGVLAAVSLLFSFALLIDCRNQEAEAAKKKSDTRVRRRKFKLPQFFRGRGANSDGLAFASQICEENMNTPPPISVEVTEPIPSTSKNLP